MLNFRQFLNNASRFLTAPATVPDLGLSADRLDIPTVEMDRPVTVHSVRRHGRVYEIRAENNFSWSCPAPHFEALQRMGKAPGVGDAIRLTFYKDGSVQSFRVVR
jgi:hypothetical protein